MSNTVQITGSLLAGPPQVGDCAFPAGVTNIGLGLSVPQKTAAVQTSAARDVASAAAFVTLDGVGSGNTVTQGNFLYLKTNAPFQIRLTQQPPSGPDVVSIVFVYGLYIHEFPSTNYLKLLEAMGTGKVEYYVSGTQ